MWHGNPRDSTEPANPSSKQSWRSDIIGLGSRIATPTSKWGGVNDLRQYRVPRPRAVEDRSMGHPVYPAVLRGGMATQEVRS